MNQTATTVRDITIPEDRFIYDPERNLSSSKLKELTKEGKVLIVENSAKSVHEAPSTKIRVRPAVEFSEIKKRYSYWTGSLDTILNKLKHQEPTEYEDVLAIAYDILEYYTRDPYYVINLINNRVPGDHDNYIAVHCVHVAILSLATGINASYNTQVLLELTVSALLHDVGHTKTFKRYLNTEYLEASEIPKYDKHVLVGVALLKKLSKVPITTALAVYQHHEFYNGTGRTAMTPPHEIHDFSSIILLADTYETRCRFHTPNRSLAFLIQDAKLGLFNKKFFSYFLTTLSLHPIGTYVINDKSEVCKVVGTNKGNINNPILNSLFKLTPKGLTVLATRMIYNETQQQYAKVIKAFHHDVLKSKTDLGF